MTQILTRNLFEVTDLVVVVVESATMQVNNEYTISVLIPYIREM